MSTSREGDKLAVGNVGDKSAVAVGEGATAIVNIGDTSHDVRGLANPYLGLRTFTFEDHAKYGGRRALIEQTIAKLTAPDASLSLLFITGASGSGKSSFAQAGLLPALVAHYGEATTQWAVFRPAQNPLAGLSDALWRRLGLPALAPERLNAQSFADHLREHTPARQVNLIVVDQFEELFTQSAPQSRGTLFDILAHLPSFSETHTHIIATLRADYLPELFAILALYEVAKRGVDLRAMSIGELAEAIQQPLHAAYPDGQKRFEPELVEKLARDAAEDAAYLPLLQVTLEEIWTRGSLTLGTYGNLTDAIKQRADKVLAFSDYDNPTPAQARPPMEQAAILDLLLDLVDVSADDDARRDVRRRRALDELAAQSPERKRLIEDLTRARLLTQTRAADDETRVEVDLIHETLLTNWERLRAAIAERRSQLRQRARFEQRLRDWVSGHSDLLDGVSLAEAHALDGRGDIALRRREGQEFLKRSSAQAEIERQKELADARRVAEAQQRAVRLLRWVVIVLILGVFGSAVGGLFALQQRDAAVSEANARATAEAQALQQRNNAVNEANARATAEAKALAQTRISDARRLAAQSLTLRDSSFDLAVLLGVEAMRLDNNVQTRGNLLDTLNTKSQLETYLYGHKVGARSVAFSPDGKLLASGSGDGTIRLWDLVTRQPIGEPLIGHESAVYSVAFSPDSKTLFSAGGDGSIRLWDMTTRQPLGQPLSYRGLVNSVAFSPDDKTLALGSNDKTLILWDVATGQPLGQPLTGDKSYVTSVAFSPDGKLLASGSYEGSLFLWDVSTRRPLGQSLATQQKTVFSVAFSPDGKTLASGNSQGDVILWDVATRQSLTLSDHNRSVLSLAFSSDGKTIASGGSDHTILLFDRTTFQFNRLLLDEDAGNVNRLAFSPDGMLLASASDDKFILLWEVATRQRLGQSLKGHTGEVSSLAFSLGSMLLVSGSSDHTILLWDGATRQPLSQLPMEHKDYVRSVALSPNGKTLASASSDQSLILWDVATGQPLEQPLTEYAENINSLAFSRDGKLLASGGNAVVIWDVARHRAIGEPLMAHTDYVRSVAFSPDGKTLASAGCGTHDGSICSSGEIILWDVSTLKPVGEPFRGHKNDVTSVAFSPDGKILASVGADQTIILWDVATRQPSGQPLTGLRRLNGVAFSPDGKLLASGSCGLSNPESTICTVGAVILWDVATGQAIGQPLMGHKDYVNGVAFSPDGKTLASGGCGKFDVDRRCTQGEIILWNMDVESWLVQACRTANRNLTRAEWAQYINSDPSTYRATCEGLPLDLP